jgi:hypothetical protein
MGDFDILGAAAIASPLILRQAMVLLGALLAAVCVARLAGSINPSIARSPGSRVAGYLDLEPEESALARIGRSVLRRVPILAELGRIEEHRRWLDLDDRGGGVTPEASTGLALVALAGGFLAALLVGEPWLTQKENHRY